jgi:hypothetical protein
MENALQTWVIKMIINLKENIVISWYSGFFQVFHAYKGGRHQMYCWYFHLPSAKIGKTRLVLLF